MKRSTARSHRVCDVLQPHPQALWTKGETSGNRLQVLETLVDCDEDTILLKVRRLGDGNVCHTGTRTCFRTFEPDS